jgi:Transposase IS66 family
MHNDDTGMRILRLAREPGDKRTGTFTSGIVSMMGAWTIAVFFTGWKHAGENLAEVLKQRTRGLPPAIQMSDALSRNSPKVEGVEPLQANCLAHGRRQVVDVADNFPEECRYVLETLRDVYHHDAQAREQAMSPEQRLRFHQEHSEPLMKGLHEWMEAQLAEHKTEPNSGLGKAISYLLNHWTKLTLFLRQAGAPIDNNATTAARGSDDIMPPPGLCRAGIQHTPLLRGISDFRVGAYRHNHRLSRKASNASGGRKRAGTTPEGLACAKAFSLSCMSACRYIWVVSVDSWPSQRAITLRSTPRRSIAMAAPCRRVCGVTVLEVSDGHF